MQNTGAFILIVLVLFALAYDHRVAPTARAYNSYRGRIGASKRGTGYVYAWQDPDQPGYIKIGRAKDWRKRIRTFQTAVPKPIRVVCIVRVKDAAYAEELLHDWFRDEHLRSGGGVEWFKATPRLLKFVKSLSDPLTGT